MSEVLIRAENVGKKFCRDLKKSLWYGMKDSVSDLFKAGSSASSVDLRSGEFWANQNVDFEVKRGECVGLIGRNGAGKTTLLKMLNGLIKPDVGSIEMKGRVSALIALGAGFSPILTGRENIFVNASILGLSRRQISEKIDEIVDFAEIGVAIDSPVQNYSSGMNVRLGFAIAAILIQPDVLLLDEVLAVGDASFRHRCYSRMNSLMSTSAVVLVSHSMDFIGQCCNQVGLMDGGRMTHFEDVGEGVTAYNQKNSTSKRNVGDDSVLALYPPVTSAEVTVLTPVVDYGGKFCVEIEIESSAKIPVGMSFVAMNLNHQPVMCWHASRGEQDYSLVPGRQTFRITIDSLLLHDGTYKYTFNMAKQGSIEHVVWYQRVGEFTVVSNRRAVGNIPYLPRAVDCQVTLHPKSHADCV